MELNIRTSLTSTESEPFGQLHELVAKLLFYRDIKTKDDADIFINPNYDVHVHDPFLMKDMQKTVVRIFDAMARQQKIVVYGDYDADGIPASVILHDYFKKVGYKNFSVYIPHRDNEGFGLHIDAINTLHAEEAKLIITVDCGITNVKEVLHAEKLGIDVIITDHHLPHGELPPAYAILNPKQIGCGYPYKMLCGSGVAFKLVQALAKYQDTIDESNFPKDFIKLPVGFEKWSLDLAGLATIADMVPLQGENRALAYYGLQVMRKTRRLGLQVLFKKLSVNQQNITEDDISFTVVPRINAASRMGNPYEAFKLLSTTDFEEAREVVAHLEKINKERKGVVGSIVKDAKARLNKRDLEDKPVIVIGNPDWKPALLGLVATSLVKDYSRPVFLWGRDGKNKIKGSCRSDKTVNLVSLLEAMPADALLEFGGHGPTGGFSVSDDAIHTFEENLIKVYQESLVADSVKHGSVEIDAELSPRDVTLNFYNHLSKLAPFGEENKKPLFLFRDVFVEQTKQFGQTKNHAEIILSKDGRRLKAIEFFSDRLETLAEFNGKTISIIGHIEKDFFPQNSFRLRIVDIL